MEKVLNQILVELKDLKGGQSRLETGMEKLDCRMGKMETRLKGLDCRMGKIEMRMESLDSRMGTLETGMEGIKSRMDSQETRMDSMESRQDGMFQVLKALEDGLNIACADIEVIKESQFRFEGRLARIEHNQELMQDDIRHLFRRDLRREEEIAEIKKAING